MRYLHVCDAAAAARVLTQLYYAAAVRRGRVAMP